MDATVSRIFFTTDPLRQAEVKVERKNVGV
jgi:hypothetical protein